MIEQRTAQPAKARSKNIRQFARLFLAFCLVVPASGIADSNFTQTRYSENSVTAGIGVRLRILPSTRNINTATQTPFTTLSTALNSDQLYSLELDTELLGNFSLDSAEAGTESPDELVSRLEKAVDQLNLETGTARNTQVVLTLSAG